MLSKVAKVLISTAVAGGVVASTVTFTGVKSIEEITDNVATMSDYLDQSENVNNELKDKLVDVEKEATDSINDANKRLKEDKNSIESMENTISSTKNKLSEIEKKDNDLRITLTKAQSIDNSEKAGLLNKIQLLTKTAEKNKSTISDLSLQNKKNNEKIASLENTISDYKKQLVDMTTEKESLLKRLEGLADKKVSTSDGEAELKLELEKAKNQIIELEQGQLQLNNTIEGLESERENLKNKLSQADKTNELEHKRDKSEINRLENEVEKANSLIEKLKDYVHSKVNKTDKNITDGVDKLIEYNLPQLDKKDR